MSKMHCDISRSSVGSRERKAVMQRIRSGRRTSVLVGHLPIAPCILKARDELPCYTLMPLFFPPERRAAYGAICQRTANRAASARPCSRSTSRLIVLWQTPGLFRSGGKCCVFFPVRVCALFCGGCDEVPALLRVINGKNYLLFHRKKKQQNVNMWLSSIDVAVRRAHRCAKQEIKTERWFIWVSVRLILSALFSCALSAPLVGGVAASIFIGLWKAGNFNLLPKLFYIVDIWSNKPNLGPFRQMPWSRKIW